jgi:hypothetical protein
MTHANTSKRCQSLRGRTLGLIVSCQLKVKESGSIHATRNAWKSGTVDKNDPCTLILVFMPFFCSSDWPELRKIFVLNRHFSNSQPVSAGNIWEKKTKCATHCNSRKYNHKLQLHHQHPTAYKTGL